MLPQTMFFVAANPECPCPPTQVGGALIIGGDETTIAITNATTNNYNPAGLSNSSVLLLTTTGDLDAVLTGLTAQQDGFTLYVWNVDQTPNTITLSHADALSSAANRFYLPGAVDKVLGQYDGVMLRYTASLNGGVGGWLAIP